MKNAKTKQNQKMLHKGLILVISVIALVIAISCVYACAAGHLSPQKDNNSNIVQNLEQKTGYIRTVGKDEVTFYTKLVERDLTAKTDSQVIEQETKKMVNRVNAEFYIANQLGLCNPYSFESLSRDMEKENNMRKVKKENSEVFYGPEQLNLISYYDYVYSNLKLKMVDAIRKQADRDMIEKAKEYFKQNKNKYKTINSTQYELKENGKTVTRVLKHDEMSTLEKTDSNLLEFLKNGKVGDVKDYALNGQNRKVKILSVDVEGATFENSKNFVLRDYVTLVYYENLVNLVSKNNPVQFDY